MRVKIVKAPGYEDEWSGELITYTRSVDGRPLAVIESDGGEWHVIPSGHVREPRTPAGYMDTDTSAHMADVSLYDECGCIAPCPDHSPRNVGKDDRAYWTDRYESEATSDDE